MEPKLNSSVAIGIFRVLVYFKTLFTKDCATCSLYEIPPFLSLSWRHISAFHFVPIIVIPSPGCCFSAESTNKRLVFVEVRYLQEVDGARAKDSLLWRTFSSGSTINSVPDGMTDFMINLFFPTHNVNMIFVFWDY